MTLVMCAPPEEAFTTMPGLNDTTMPTASYSGYLDIPGNKSLHYIFVQSERGQEDDAVVIWFNGGPGCSSLLAFFQENGPFAIDDGETWVKRNPHPWNQNVSMLYLESPAGVGYSVANTSSGLIHNDMT
jgi:carboxypeptidase C (cathepsin A)